MEQLLDILAKLQDKAQRYRTELSNNEFLVRYALIDPLLRALGWDTENPEQVRPEETISVGRPDYALLDAGATKLFIGAKALGKPEDLEKLITYCNAKGVPHFVATDGVHWELYEVFRPVPTPQKKVIEFDLLSMDLGEVARRALALWRRAPIGTPGSIPAVIPSTPAMPPLVATASPTPPALLPSSSSPAKQQAFRGSAIASLSVQPKDPHPKGLIDPNGVMHELHSWKDVLVVVVDWLVKHQALTPAHCPVKLPQGSRYIVHTTSKHPNGKDFFQPVKVGPVWVETHASAAHLVRQAVFLLTTCGQDAAAFDAV